jgi:type IV pilus assembly protein PilQ
VLAILLAWPSGPEPASAQQPAGNEPAGEDVSVTDAGRVELHVQGADLRRVLQLLSTQSKTNIIATKDVTGKVTADLYGVTFIEALEAVLKSSGFEYERKGKFIFVMTAEEKAEREAAKRKRTVRVFKLNYLKSEDAKTLCSPALSETGTISVSPSAEVGVSPSATDAGGNALAAADVIVVRDYPENVEKIEAILKELDVRPAQVLIEATILRATLTEDNALGVDLTALAGVDFRQVGATSANAGISNPQLGDLPGDELDHFTLGANTDLTDTLPPGGLNLGIVYNEVAFFIRALETVTDVSVLANPKLLVMNKQRGEVMAGNRDGYLTTTITETAATQTVEFIETGTQLIVRPYVSSDGYVRLEIHPKDSTGGVTAEQLPFEQTTEATSNVIVKDGHTIVIGGLFRERAENRRGQVPGLGNLPVLGNAFRRRQDATRREEVIILITPHIIRHPADEVTSEQIKDQVRRIRLGVRQGMMWFGRERLAQSHMRWARQHFAAGRNDQALWDVKMALSLEPRMVEALEMKERLTRRAIWRDEPRYSSAAYIIQRMIMQDLGEPVEKVAIPYKPLDGRDLDAKVRRALGIGEEPELPPEGPEWEQPADPLPPPDED